MFSVLLVSSLIFCIIACPAGTGSFGKHAEFSTKIFPSVDWCQADGGDLGQRDRSSAYSNRNDTIRSAIKQALAEYGAPSDSFKITDIVSGIVEASELVQECAGSAPEKKYSFYKKTVYNSCDDASALPLDLKVSITVEEDLYESQWRAIAVKTQERLERKDISFDENIAIKLIE